MLGQFETTRTDQRAESAIGAELSGPTHGRRAEMSHGAGGKASRAVAFEDSLSGLRAAVASGATTVGLTTSLSERAILDEGAVMAIADFRDARLWSLLETMNTPAVAN